jgi:hypothetical protein
MIRWFRSHYPNAMELLGLPFFIERRLSDFLQLVLKAFRIVLNGGVVAWILPARRWKKDRVPRVVCDHGRCSQKDRLWTVRRGPPSRCAWIVLLHKQPILPTPIWDDMKESRTMMARTISPARIEHTSTAQSSRCKDKPNATAGIWSTALSKCKELWTRP